EGDYDYEVASELVAPTATTSLSTEDWTNLSVTSSLESCEDVTEAESTGSERCKIKSDGTYNYLDCEYASGCDEDLNNTQTETIHNNGETSTLTVVDNAGLKRSVESNPAKIDYLKPIMGTPVVTATFEGADYSVSPSTDPSNPTQLAANDEFVIDFGVEDDTRTTTAGIAGTSCTKADGCDSGVSGLDYDSSTITVSGPGGASLPETAFDELAGEVQFLGTTVSIEEGSQIFQIAGNYTVTLKFFDKARNVSELSLYVTIVAANADQGATGSTVNGPTCNSVLANNSDACTATAVIKDRFGNIVKNRDYGFNTVEGQDQNGSYDLTVDAEQAFLNGVRVDTGTITATGDVNLIIKSLVPTVLVLEETKGGDSVYYVPETGGVIERAAEVVIDVADVDGLGNVDGTMTNINLEMNDLEYLPWVDLHLTDKSSQLSLCPAEVGVSDPLEINVGSEDLTIYVCAKNAANRVLPSSGLGTRLIGHSDEEMNFESADIDKDINNNPEGIALALGAGGTKQTASLTTRLTATGGSITDLSDIAISSKVVITMEGHEVVYPGGSIGITEAFKGVVVGADVEGSVLGSTSKISYVGEDSALVKTGGVNTKDVREEITTNAYSLVRSATPIESNTTLTRIDFSGGDIKYYKGVTVTLEDNGDNEVLIEGKGTIVIENGNLQINSNMKYDGGSDSLGVIMINTSSAATPTTGNVYVYKNVKNMVGTYFADGGLMTTLSPAGYAEPSDRDVQLISQLILAGTILTRNT
ncbi:MAG: hypothetical protein OEL89_04990, partial [Candidatus Peregrinibacteria bacterium]|nr:hypothetical protein [Candidatus Peregrinibacteria bacterium]